MVRAVILILLGFCLNVESSSAQKILGFRLPERVKKVTIPFETYNNLIVVPVILNDVLPLKFVLDTGVRTTILTQKTFSDILNLSYDRHIVIRGVGGEKLVDAYVTNGVSLELPGVKGEGHTMLVLDRDHIELSNYLGTQVHGVLGYEIFSRFIVKIDFEKKHLTLLKHDKFKRKKKFIPIPISIEDTKPYLATTITQQGGKSFQAKLMIDSGASHGLLIEQDSDTAVFLPENTINSNIGRGLGGDLYGKIGRIERLRFGKYEFNNVIATYPDLNSYIDSVKSEETFRHGTLGGEILSRFTCIFDYSSETLYLKKNAAYKKAFEYNMSGIMMKATGKNLSKYQIVEVREGSSAEKAGVKSGDYILSVNFHRTENFPLQEVIGLFNSKHNRSLRLELERNGKRIRKKFKLIRQI